jgi:hypothetical protein
MRVFSSFSEWWLYLSKAATHLLKGIVRLLLAVMNGIASVLVWLWNLSVRWVARNPHIALGGFLLVLCVLYVVMSAQNRAIRVGLESQRDSIEWQFTSFKESHGYE